MSPAASTPAPRTALDRWQLGHHAFHIQLVAMITLLDELCGRPIPGDERTVTLLIDLAALFGAATASMKYASSFDSSAYEGSIRPTMTPPAFKPGFSGLLNVEHERMKAALAPVPRMLDERFGPDSTSWEPPIRDAWDDLVVAHRELYRHHGLVCRRLVSAGPSLLRIHGRRPRIKRDDGTGAP